MTPSNIWFIVMATTAVIIATWLVMHLKADHIGNAYLAEEKAKERERARIQAEEDRKKRHIEKLQSLKDAYGEITIELPLSRNSEEWDDFSKVVLIFEGTKVALIDNKPLSFKQILSYALTDNQNTISTTVGHANTNTSTGSMIGRALVGGALLGGVGAIAGASTASKNTSINTTTSHQTTHDYIVYLNIDDIANPQRVLRFGKNGEAANKAASVFNIIINRNNQ